MPDVPAQRIFVEYGDEAIPVSVRFEKRKRLTISVHPDGSVTAVSPISRSLDQVRNRLEKRKSWMAKHRRFFARYQPLPEPKRYVSGETHLYLGRQYRLKVRLAPKTDVKLIGRYFNVWTPTPEIPCQVESALDRWYRQHAKSIFRDRTEQCLREAPSLRSRNPKLRLRKMTKRWGSCSKAGTVTLSTELIKVPLACIEYVIMHELCHLLIHDHSAGFYRLLGRCMPDWEQRKALIDSFAFP